MRKIKYFEILIYQIMKTIQNLQLNFSFLGIELCWYLPTVCHNIINMIYW